MAVAESRTKVVVRRLPPALDEATFRSALGQWIGRTNWIDYCAGRVTPRKAVSSRAYLNFNTPGDAMQFLEGARNQTLSLEDSSAPAWLLHTEFAPFQRVPKPSRRRDPRAGTIDKDREYLAFVAAMEAGEEAVSLPAVERRTDPEGPTPLVKYLLERQAAAAKRSKSGAKATKDKGPEKKPSDAPAGAAKKDAEKKQKTRGKAPSANSSGAAADKATPKGAKASAAKRDSGKKPVQILQRRASEPGEAEGAVAPAAPGRPGPQIGAAAEPGKPKPREPRPGPPNATHPKQSGPKPKKASQPPAPSKQAKSADPKPAEPKASGDAASSQTRSRAPLMVGDASSAKTAPKPEARRRHGPGRGSASGRTPAGPAAGS